MSHISPLLRRLFGEKLFFSFGYYYLLTQKEFRKSQEDLRHYKNKHLGERCFIIGNGPSLNKMDLSLLRDETTFGANRIYLFKPKRGINITYYLCVNKLVVSQFASEISQQVHVPKFLSYDTRYWIKNCSGIIFLYSREGPKFYKDITKGVWQGATVTYVGMQLAYFMGFKQVILIGVDHHYRFEGSPHKVVTSQSRDVNHFDANYFGPGHKWHLPDLEQSEFAYKLAKEVYEEDGREIIDATVGGKLNVFRKVDYYSLF